jgi:hypothetical protein
MRQLRVTRVLTGLLVLAAAATPSAQMRGLGRIKGTVVDAASGSPIRDVTVATRTMDGKDISGRSSADGMFTLNGLGRGEWLVTFKKEGFADKRVKLVIEKELMSNAPFKVRLAKES